ncbi:eCIS core domain-containing protein [Streptomyces decoyicus]|uniref:eCIS core domain-containing protein n=1 Tax=Streptomyces decoyicus TaxID=249567 RepID=UPI00382FE575
MHDHEKAGTTGTANVRTPAHKPVATPSTPPRGLLPLQASAGNAAVVQMLRQAGHSWAPPEQHQHNAGCGHRTEQPAVQRSVVHDILRTSGRPLDEATRSDMEARLGADFSDVRIHDDSAAKASAAEVGARAYTSGSHVVIGAGGNDKHTLAHELTHVVQQRQGPVAGTDNGAGLRVSDPSDRFEREAEATARRAMSGSVLAGTGAQRAAASVSSVVAPTVQRNVQDHLTDQYWQERASNQKPVKAPTKTSKGRTGDGILLDIGPKLIKELANMCAGKSETELDGMGRLELFRAMEATEAADIEEWWGGEGHTPTEKITAMNDWIMANQGEKSLGGAFNKTYGETKKTARDPDAPKDGILPIGHHLGDEEQARTYYKKPATQVLMKFTLKPGAHELLFHPDHMAVSGESKGRTPQSLRNLHGGMPQAKKGEGMLEGYVGIKQENPRQYAQDEQGNRDLVDGRGDFSLALGTKWSRLLFQMFVERIERVR